VGVERGFVVFNSLSPRCTNESAGTLFVLQFIFIFPPALNLLLGKKALLNLERDKLALSLFGGASICQRRQI
jgi:hypothetical protein